MIAPLATIPGGAASDVIAPQWPYYAAGLILLFFAGVVVVVVANAVFLHRPASKSKERA